MSFEFFDIDDENHKRSNETTKMELDPYLYKIEILQQRYNWLRNEIDLNLDHRYKIMQLLMALLPVTYSVIAISKLYFISILASVLVWILFLLFYSVNKSIADISDYLLKLEEFIDSNANLPIRGWESYARDPKMKKIRATWTLHITFMLLFLFSYSFYNLIFCYYFTYTGFIVSLISNLYHTILDPRIIIFLILELPVLLLVKYFLSGVSDYFQKK